MTAADPSGWLDRTHVGDCRDLLRQMASDGIQVQMCVTSPPYFRQRDYEVAGQIGLEATPDEYVDKIVEVCRDVRRILSDAGTLWLNLGDTYCTRSVRRDDGMRTVIKAYAQGSENAGLSKWSEYAARGRVNYSSRHKAAGIKDKDLFGIPWLVAFALRKDGWFLRQDIVWAKPNPMPESVKDRCTRSHEYLFLLSKSKHYYFDHEAIREPSLDPRGPGNLQRVQIPPGQKVSGATGHVRGGLHLIGPRDMRNKRDVWTIANRPFRGAHFAVFPDELVTPCILAGSRNGDVVLDPFMGAGTTAAAAERLGRHFIGCELNGSFLDLHHQRRQPIGRNIPNSMEEQS